MAAASLSVLDKTKDGVFYVRGEILRRLVAKCLCVTHKRKHRPSYSSGGDVIHFTRYVVNSNLFCAIVTSLVLYIPPFQATYLTRVYLLRTGLYM